MIKKFIRNDFFKKNLGNFRCMFFSQTTKQNENKVVVITGCDSGLGYSLSIKYHHLGLKVVSGCLDPNSEGSKKLTPRCFVHQLNVRDVENVKEFYKKIQKLLTEKNYELHAVVNNAGVMVFGEFEWYTEEHILQQIEVNLTGYLRVAKIFLPLLRQYKGRLINVTSHCALCNLPTLTVYGATKAAIQSWTEGLRSEQQKYGVKVISFIPGSFPSQSNIMASQELYSKEMEKEFTSKDKEFYGKYFKDFNCYLQEVAGHKRQLFPIEDDKLYEKFTEALLHENPKPRYKHEPWRYFFYYNAFRISPLWLREYLIKKFMKFPQFECKSGKS